MPPENSDWYHHANWRLKKNVRDVYRIFPSGCYKHLHHEYRLLNRSIKILVNATFPTDQYLALKPNNLMLLQKQSVMYVANCQPLTEYDKVSYHNYNPSRSDLILAGYFHWVLFLLPPGQSQNFYHHQDTTGYSYQHERLIYKHNTPRLQRQ